MREVPGGGQWCRSYTSPRSTYSSSELEIALHNRNALCVDRAKVPDGIPSDFERFDAVFVGDVKTHASSNR